MYLFTYYTNEGTFQISDSGKSFICSPVRILASGLLLFNSRKERWLHYIDWLIRAGFLSDTPKKLASVSPSLFYVLVPRLMFTMTVYFWINQWLLSSQSITFAKPYIPWLYVFNNSCEPRKSYHLWDDCRSQP